MSKKVTTDVDVCVKALAKIVAAVQYKAEHGRYPDFPGNVSFEKWVGDVAAKAIGYSAVPELDKFISQT